MRVKKIISILTLITLIISQFSFIGNINPVYANDEEISNEIQYINGHYRYYYEQLSEQAKKIYDAMCEMYETGSLKQGNVNYDLIANGKVNESQIEDYKKGSRDIIIAFETARDAFYLDYPDVFYINIEKYSIRITSDSNGYHLWLGTGNNDSYMLQGFTSEAEIETAIQTYNTAVDTIVNGARTLESTYSGKELIEKQIRYVHDEVVKSATYKLDNECAVSNRGHIRTPYGALVAKEAVCEGYSKAMKVALDKLAIPCVLIRGVYKPEDSTNGENHMWNYVQIDEKWYAVDSTFDDYGGKYAYTDYLLAGYSTMQKGHNPMGVMSAPEFEFKLPELEYEDYGIEQAYDYNGLVVNYGMTTGETLDGDEFKGGKFYINYKGMGMETAKNNGFYFLVRYEQTGDWFYLEIFKPEYNYYGSGNIEDSQKELIFYNSSIKYLEFAVTDVKYKEPIVGSEMVNGTLVTNQVYQSSEEHIIAKTEPIDNIYQWKPSPNMISAYPYLGTKLKPGKKTHIKITYNDKLVPSNDGETPGIYVTSNAWTTSAEVNSKLENFGHDNYSVWFDFTPSSMWGDNSVIYNFEVKGLVGNWSGLKPRSSYYYVQETFGCTYSMAQADKWKVYGRPTLIDTGDIDFTGWELSDGIVTAEEAKVLNQVKEKMALVVTPTNKQQEQEINNLIESTENNTEVLKMECYNINLVVCNKNVLKTANGDKMTVYLGFPEGYGPESAGVTFKVYHIANGNNVEEIECVVTPYGLLVTCDAFSPYAVAVLKASEEDLSNKTKSIVITTDENGIIEGLNTGIVNFNPEEEKTYIIKANEGYQIDSLTVFGTEVTEAVGSESYNLTVNYRDILDSNIVNVTFVAKTVAQGELSRGEKIVEQEVETVIVEDMPEKIISSYDQTVTIAPTITNSTGIDTYQWYKNGQKLVGQTAKTLTLENVSELDEGEYILKVTSTVNASSKEYTSNPCRILIKDFSMKVTTNKNSVKPGEIFEVEVSIENFRNIEQGILAIMGKLHYDKNLLEIVMNDRNKPVTPSDGWNLSSHEGDEFNFIADNDERIKEDTLLYKIKFRAKEIEAEEVETEIIVQEVTASEADGVIHAVSDANQKISIKKEKALEDEFESDIYEIDNINKIVSRISPKTTVSMFKTNVYTNTSLIITDENERVLGEDDFVTTGSILKVGSTLEYTLCVTGDLDGDGLVKANDIAKLKLHCIKDTLLTGIYLIAGDIDNDKEISVNDVAQAKLASINLLDI